MVSWLTHSPSSSSATLVFRGGILQLGDTKKSSIEFPLYNFRKLKEENWEIDYYSQKDRVVGTSIHLELRRSFGLTQNIFTCIDKY